jgi:SAM-dependent methyltransferase
MSARALFTLHSGIPREAPGSDASTREAILRLGRIPSSPLILDVGCGPGSQTLVLAEALGGSVVAVDIHQPYLDRLDQAASRFGLSDRIRTVNASMDALHFPEETFDLVWAEGAAYILGLSRSLGIWRRLLCPGGAAAFTELSWLPGDRPAEAVNFWKRAYPEMDTIAGNVRRAEIEGFEVFHSFVLPESDWRGFYAPLQARIEALRGQAASDADLAAVIAATEEEIALYSRCGGSFGYVFYLARRS